MSGVKTIFWVESTVGRWLQCRLAANSINLLEERLASTSQLLGLLASNMDIVPEPHANEN